MNLDIRDIDTVKNLKGVFNLAGLEVSVHGIVLMFLCAEKYEMLGVETTIRDISACMVEAIKIIESLKEQEE